MVNSSTQVMHKKEELAYFAELDAMVKESALKDLLGGAFARSAAHQKAPRHPTLTAAHIGCVHIRSSCDYIFPHGYIPTMYQLDAGSMRESVFWTPRPSRGGRPK
eukprot:6323496-Pyramimonas_sp.AAC.1